MSTEIKFKTVAMHGQFKPGQGGCAGRIIHNDALSMDGIAREFAQYAKIGEHEARLYASLFADWVVKAVGEGKRLNFDAFSLYLTMKGKIIGANGSFSPVNNSIELNILQREPLRKALAQLVPVNATLDNESVRIVSVLDERHGKEGIVTKSATCYAAGGTFLIDAARDDEGVWLEAASGAKVLRARIINSTATTLDFVLEGDAEPGRYRLAVYTRMGNSKRPAPAVARRTVNYEL